MTNHDSSKSMTKLDILDKAQAYCARAEHCAADVRRKLYEWQAEPDWFDEIEQKLYDDDFLNDERFCTAFVHDKVEYQRWGRIKIKAALLALQLPERLINQALNAIDTTTYSANLQHLAKQRRADSPDKRLRFLLQRGYTYEEIARWTK